MSKQRILYIDLLKLFTIYLVLWGHAIMHFQPDYEQSYIFRTIYAFHMPLFMMLSGYFAPSSMLLGIREFFPKKFRQLLLPCISWGVLCWLVITSGLIEGRFHLELKGLFTGWLGIVDNFWFLKSCFICYTLSWLCYRCGRYKVVAIIIIWVLCTMQGRFFLDWMFPSFLLGLYLRNSQWLQNNLEKYHYALYSIFVVLLAVSLLMPWNEIYLFKLALGLSGALACFVLFQSTIGKLEPTPTLERLARLGGATLGIYVIQAILLEYILPHYVSFEAFPIVGIVFLMPLLSFVALFVCFGLVQTIRKSRLLGFIMLGEKYQK